MMNNIEIFKNREFGNIRIIQEGDKLLFCGKDVAQALGYTRPNDAVSAHCRCTVKRRTPHPQSPSKQIELLFIPESDVYRLIIHSKLPSAERFEKWLFEEVLPTIRRHGAYMTEATLAKACENPAVLNAIVDNLIAERQKNTLLAAENADLSEKAAFFDAFAALDGCTNLRTTAKELGIPERQFCRALIEAGFLYRAPAGNLMPYNNKKTVGMFRVRDYCRNGHTGAYTLVTAQGKQLLRALFND